MTSLRARALRAQMKKEKQAQIENLLCAESKVAEPTR